jgi:hypothetical protein
MTTAYLDFMKGRDRFAFGPFVFAWFETNPEEHPDCMLCHSSSVGPHIATLDGEMEWERNPRARSIQLVTLSDVQGKILLITGFKERDAAAQVMQQAREVGSAREPERHFVN